jgi:hypothetical protein
MAIPPTVEKFLNDSAWLRQSTVGLDDALSELGIAITDDIGEFFFKYWGPFSSDSVGYELLDLVEDDESILTSTRVGHEVLGFPSCFVILSSMNGLAVLVYDSATGCVYDVNLEGGDQLLKAGQLTPRWHSWNDFLLSYFT